MDSKKVVAAVAGGVVLMIVGFLLYGVVLMSFYENGTMAGVMKDPPDWLFLSLGQLAGGVLLVFVLGWAGAKTPAAGAKTGALLGLLLGLVFNLTMYGTANINSMAVTLVDPFVAAVQVGIAGAVVGMLLGKGGAAAM